MIALVAFTRQLGHIKVLAGVRQTPVFICYNSHTMLKSLKNIIDAFVFWCECYWFELKFFHQEWRECREEYAHWYGASNEFIARLELFLIK